MKSMNGTRNLVLTALVGVCVTLTSPARDSIQATSLVVASGSPSDAVVTARMAKLPLRFEANAGQWDEHVRFIARQGGATLFITDEGMTISLRDVKALPHGVSREEEDSAREQALAEAKTAAVTIKLVGAKPAAPHGEKELITKSNFFLGNDKTKWRTNVPNYGQVRAKDWAPGIDVVWHGGENGLEYDVEVAAGVDARELSFEIDGADRIDVAEDGSLEIATAAGVLSQRSLKVMQDGRELRTRYVVRGGKGVGFAVDGYDAASALLIDPVLTYSTYLGGGGQDDGVGIAIDSAGSAYVTGATDSTDFPTANPYQGMNSGGGGGDVFVTKLNASGSALTYSTYLGGSSTDRGQGIAVDASGNAYVTGHTQSTNFPKANAYQGTSGGGFDAFVTKLSASGSVLTYSTYLGGSGFESGQGIAVDGSGNAYAMGHTGSTNFPTANAYQGANGGGGNFDVFVTKFNAAGSALTYSTYLGGNNDEQGQGIAVDGSGNAYVTGSTISTNFPTTSAYQGAYGGGTYDAFVTKFNASGSALTYSTYLGGNNDDEGRGIAVDASGNAYVIGFTASTNFPTAGAYQTVNGGGGNFDAFVTKFNAAGSALGYSTYLGGSLGEQGRGIAVDAMGAAYVTGYTTSTNFPTASPTQSYAGGTDAFVTKLNPAGLALTYSTFLGGGNADIGESIAVDGNGNAFVTGRTSSANFPTASPYQAASSGMDDVFIAKFADPELPAGTPCTTSGPCASGLSCTDGVCCGPCTDQCSACDVLGHIGTCTPVTGVPHNSRMACAGTGACGSSCDGMNTKACTYATASTVCASACSSGVETDSNCNGKGDCAVGGAHSCNNLVCADAKVCKSKCATNVDCAVGFTCAPDGTCAPGGVCTDDHTSKGAGVSTDCTPYKCDSSGTCAKKCISVDDCLSPTVCNTSGQCVSASSASSGGCNTEPASSAPWFVLLAMFGISLVRLRVRRARR